MVGHSGSTGIYGRYEARPARSIFPNAHGNTKIEENREPQEKVEKVGRIRFRTDAAGRWTRLSLWTGKPEHV